MSGHSRWAGIKHKKAAVDAKRGKMFTKFIREVTVAAREGGGNPDNNPRLRKAIEQAREVNMPADNIKKAVQRGTGELPGSVFEELVYEGYGPAGVAVMCEITTDNKNRTASEIRKIFSEHGGSLGENGCVGWMFTKKGLITVPLEAINEDDLLNIALEAGAEDMQNAEEEYEITTAPSELESIKNAIAGKGVNIGSAEATLLPQTYITLSGKDAESMVALMNELDGHDDVKNIYSNFDIPKETMEKIEG